MTSTVESSTIAWNSWRTLLVRWFGSKCQLSKNRIINPRSPFKTGFGWEKRKKKQFHAKVPLRFIKVPVMEKNIARSSQHVYSLTIFFMPKLFSFPWIWWIWISNQEILMSFLQKMEARTHFLSNSSAVKSVYESTCYKNRNLKSSRLKEDNF